MEEKQKTAGELRREALLYQPKNGYDRLSAQDEADMKSYCEDYKKFLDAGKTERECVTEAVRLAEAKGFKPFTRGMAVNPGDKLYRINRGKALMLAVVGTRPLSEGVNIGAAHIDSPRLDLKPNPLYEDAELAFFKTHYYGGIKKYQWSAIPLSLHGRVVKKDGSYVDIVLGEDQDDPQFCVTDLLPHLGGEQMKKPAAKIIEGEDLNILVGSRPFKSDKGSELVKLNILKLLNERYGITEYDFLSAELELVPAFQVTDIGFDRSMIGGYGHDDRVCAYPALMAVLDQKIPDDTVITILTDKEETGSDGNTGLNSDYLRYFVADLAMQEGLEPRHVLSRSACLSADVNAAFDPTFASAYEANNASFLNNGVVVTKYTGSGGKGGTSDASAEFMGRIRSLLDKKKVLWQVGELGKVDGGGGGTVAKYIANMNVDVVDVGVPVLSMHAPFEVVSKIDVYMAYRAFYEFFKD